MSTPPRGAFQDAIPHNHCWGCGTLNPRGLHIKSRWDPGGAESVCDLVPGPEFMAGPTDVLYGGYVAAVIDCHCVCTAIADAYRQAGRALGSEPLVWCVTAALRLDFLAPTPLGAPIALRARILERKGRKRVLGCVLTADGRERAKAELVAVEVPLGWPAGAGKG